jgi:hypothetical protein
VQEALWFRIVLDINHGDAKIEPREEAGHGKEDSGGNG